MAALTTAGANIGGGYGGNVATIDKTKPVLEKTKSVSYSATQSDQIFAVSTDPASATKETLPRLIEIENNGQVPIMLMVGYQEYSSDTAESGNPEYLHTMLTPGQTFNPPIRAIIRTGESTVIMDGTPLSNEAPSVTANFAYLDSTTNLAEDIATDETAIDVADGDFFRVNDLIQVGINTTTATKIEIMRITAISTNTLTVTRALYGTTQSVSGSQTNATNGAVSGADVHFPFFNAYHDHDKYTVVQTDSNGKFKCFNFFGKGRTASAVQGIVPGSIALKPYSQGYQSLSLSGVTSSTNSGLTAGGGTTYQFTIAVDGGSAYDLDLTPGTNVNWGGTDGIISKLNDVFETAYYTAGNLLGKKVSVGIENGDIVFRSGSRLATSAVVLADSSGGDTDIWGEGRVPAFANISASVDAKLPDDVIYDPITYATIPNTGAFMYDDGMGRLFTNDGSGSGTCNYETGALDFRWYPECEFVFSCLHTSAFSGRLNESQTDRINSLVDIYANTTSQKWNGSVKVKTY